MLKEKDLPISYFVGKIFLKNEGELNEGVVKKIKKEIYKSYRQEAVEDFNYLMSFKLSKQQFFHILTKLEKNFWLPCQTGKFLTLNMLELKDKANLIRALTKIKLEFGEERAQIFYDVIDNLRSMPNLKVVRVIDKLEQYGWSIEKTSNHFRFQPSER